MLIYIAAPYSGDVNTNIRRACLVGDEILKRGHIPIIPHLSHLWDTISPKPYGEWIAIGMSLMSYCDAVLRIGGESPGADLEIEEAKRLCMIIYYSLDEIWEVPNNMEYGRGQTREYCEDAFKLRGIRVWCDDCPFLNNCPRLIMEDAVDEAVLKAIEAMREIVVLDKGENVIPKI